MRITITTAALWEPRRDIAGAGKKPVGVQLNLDIAEGYAGDPAGRFRTFLEAVPNCKLAAYKRNGLNLELVASGELSGSKSSTGLAADIHAWLEAGVDQGGIWTSAVYTPKPGEKPTDRELAFDDDKTRPSAGARLGSAQSWAAPVPHVAGLTRLLAVPDDQTEIYVVPWFDSEPAGNIPVEDLGGGVVGFDLPSRPGADWEVVRCEAAPTIEFLVDATTLIADNGFLRTGDAAADVGRLLKQLREQAGTALWAAPQLIGLQWPQEPGDEPGNARLQRRLVWRAASGVAALLDPLLLAMGMADDRRLGPFAARLAAVLAEKHGKLGLADELRKVMGGWNGLHGPIDAAMRKRFFEVSGRLLGRPDWTLDDKEVLPELLAAFRDDSLPLPLAENDAVKQRLADFAVKLDAELQALLTRIGGEDGIEAAFLTSFQDTEPGFAWLTSHFPVEQVPDAANPGQFIQDDSKRAAALATIRNAFGQGFNALDAARHANGAVFAGAIAHKSPVAPTMEDFRGRLTAGKWFTRRFGLPGPDPAHAFAEIVKHLPQIPASLLDADDLATIVEAADAADAATAEDLLHRFDMAGARTRRFVADVEPQDVHLQIAVDSDTSDGDLFEQCYDGIGVLVTRDGADWVHAHLAMTVEEPDAALTIVPSRPAVIDGERQLFLTYDGVPFADAAFEDDSDELEPFRSHDAPVTFGSHRKLPALAYGVTYQFAAYAVSRSGVLPPGVSDPADCLAPATAPAPPTDAGFTSKHTHSRTTAIGAATLEQPAEERQPPIDRIQPLTSDYPRLGLSAGEGSAPFIDLWRASDGSALVILPKAGESQIELNIADLRFINAQALSLELIADPARAEPATAAAVDLPVNSEIDCIRLTLIDKKVTAFVDGQTAGEDLPVPIGATAVWVRLRLQPKAGKVAMASFADPRGAIAGSVAGAAPEPDKLIVLAPDDKEWQTDFPTSAKMTLRFPAMGVEDFDRWLSNKTLLDAATIGGDAKKVEAFRIGLLDAALSGDAALENHRDAIPDLAVGALQVQLTLLDWLGNEPTPGTTTDTIIPMETLGVQVGKLAGSNFAARLDQLRKLRKAELVISSRPEGGKLEIDGAKLAVSVPAGATARLTVRRLVKTELFDNAVIDARIKELAVGAIQHRGIEYLLFDGPACTIETMCALPRNAADWYTAAKKWIAITPARTARKYSIDLDPGAHKPELWKRLGEADVITQRWRFLGRPIHNWFAPKLHAKLINGPVAWLANDKPEVRDFEAEAFARSDTDAVSKTVRLKPLGQISLLRDCEWEAPSATMFRHRVRLRGRYAGALRTPARAEILVVEPPPKRGAKKEDGRFDTWVRVVMLADRTRLALTRPNLRALIPLTTSPDSRAAPPLLAMMTEPPYAFGGLADRIASGVATGFGYEMQGKTLGLQAEARGEAGPDPVHSYRSLDPAVALSLGLEAEGPIGLTFDNDSAPAAAYPNSAWLLTPAALSKPEMDWQEHFVSVTLRRYLDPDWIDGEVSSKSDGLDFAETAWITVEPGKGLFDIKAAGKPLLNVSRKANEWIVKVAKPAILSDCTDYADMVEVARLPDLGVEKLALLHQPLEPGRAAMSVFAVGRDNDRSVANGAIEVPRLVASFEWRFAADPQKPVDPTPPAAGAPPTPARARLEFSLATTVAYTSASAPTALEWGRTGRNAEIFDSDYGAVGWHDLRLVEVGSELTFSKAGEMVWLQPSLRASPSVLHVHRHLALLPTRNAGGQGRALELFERPATLLLARKFPGGKADRLRVMEFETPARPMGSGDLVPPAFNAVSFALASVCEPPLQTEGALLVIRPVGAASQAASLVTLSLNDKEFRIEPPAGSGNLASIVLRATWGKKLKADFVNASGSITSLPLAEEPVIERPTDEIVALSLKKPASGEWWADVSMLVLSKAHAGALDTAPLEFEFTWLFGGPGPELETGLDHRSLRTMTEAQARVVRVSPPITIG